MQLLTGIDVDFLLNLRYNVIILMEDTMNENNTLDTSNEENNVVDMNYQESNVNEGDALNVNSCNNADENISATKIKKKGNLLNKVGIVLCIPGIVNSLFIYVPVLLSLTNIYEGDPYAILLPVLLTSVLFPLTLVAFIVWAILVHRKKVKQGVPLREYKIAYIFWGIDFALFAILVVPFIFNFINNLFL